MNSIAVCFILIVVLQLQINLLFRKVDKLESIQEILDKQLSKHEARINLHDVDIEDHHDEVVGCINVLEAEIRGLREVHNRNVETVTQILKSHGERLRDMQRQCYGFIRREDLGEKPSSKNVER